MSRQDAKRGADVAGEQQSLSPADTSTALSDAERGVLDVLLASKGSRTITQLSASCGLDKKQITSALENLHSKGLITRLNTVVASYAARFPGVGL